MSTILFQQNADAAKLELPDLGPWSPEQFLAFCEANPGLQAELDAQGAIHILSPSNADAEGKVSILQGELYVWSKSNGGYKVFGSNAGFTLESGAVRAPDVSLVDQAAWDGLSEQARRSFFAPVAPFFVIELRSSESDSLSETKEKMLEYLDNGVRLGWLVDPVSKTFSEYRPGVEPSILQAPAIMDEVPELPGFVIDLTPMWE